MKIRQLNRVPLARGLAASRERMGEVYEGVKLVMEIP
jgi:hypothetical protein